MTSFNLLCHIWCEFLIIIIIKTLLRNLLYTIFYMPSVVRLIVHTCLERKRPFSIILKMSTFRSCTRVFLLWNLILERIIFVLSAVKWLIAINHFQNKLCLHNVCVLCAVYIYYVYINTHTYMYIFKKYLHVYMYIQCHLKVCEPLAESVKMWNILTN